MSLYQPCRACLSEQLYLDVPPKTQLQDLTLKKANLHLCNTPVLTLLLIKCSFLSPHFGKCDFNFLFIFWLCIRVNYYFSKNKTFLLILVTMLVLRVWQAYTPSICIQNYSPMCYTLLQQIFRFEPDNHDVNLVSLVLSNFKICDVSCFYQMLL